MSANRPEAVIVLVRPLSPRLARNGNQRRALARPPKRSDWPRDLLHDNTPLRATGSTENEMPSAERRPRINAPFTLCP